MNYTGREMETVGIEPTTFHMYMYAKRLVRVLGDIFDE
jgi:hypothetical protein